MQVNMTKKKGYYVVHIILVFLQYNKSQWSKINAFWLHPRKLDGSYITCIVRDLNSFSSSAIEPLGGATIVD